VIREYCHAANITEVIILGDLFHDRRTLDIEVLARVVTFFEETVEKYGQNWIAFPGNHDMFLRHSWEINSLTALRRHLTVIEDIKILQIDHARFWVLPFVTYERSYMYAVKSIQKQAHGDDMLLTHIGVNGATNNSCFLLPNWSVVNFDATQFKRIYTGHFHCKQQIGENIWYPGSPIPFKFDEGDVPHGFYCYDLVEDSHKFINIWRAGARFLPDEPAPPQFCTLLDELLEEKTEEMVRGNMIRVALQRDYTADELREMKLRLLDMGARVVRWLDLNRKREEDAPVMDVSQHKDLFRAWVGSDEKGKKDLDEKLLFTTHTEVVREGDELYAVDEAEDM
jgi:DNA repair exonuclease SbcCD nuclease subunit